MNSALQKGKTPRFIRSRNRNRPAVRLRPGKFIAVDNFRLNRATAKQSAGGLGTVCRLFTAYKNILHVLKGTQLGEASMRECGKVRKITADSNVGDVLFFITLCTSDLRLLLSA